MRFLSTLAALLLLASPALAGPNNGGTIFLHDAGLDYELSVSDYCGEGSAPPSCDQADVEIDVETPVVWKVYAAFSQDNDPRLKAIVFGIDYDEGGIAISAWGTCADFELAETDWPVSGSGTALVFNQVQTDYLVEIYWFAGYRSSANPQLFTLTGHPQQGGVFADDSVPAILDPIAGYGSLGFGTSGAPACPPPALPRGACCAPNGSCTVTPEIGCDYDWLGEGTVCDPNPCPQPPVGACCQEDGSCTVTTEAECFANWLGDGTNCDPNPCPQPPVGACCDPNGTCSVTIEMYCSGNWLGQETGCDPNPCPQLGACCYPDGGCSVSHEFACDGEWQGPGTNCDPNPCYQPPAGACCAPNGSCTVTIEYYCSGDWLGEGIGCDPNPCPQPPLGACCAPNGSCTVSTEYDCGGLWMGAGTDCDPNPCPQPPLGACCAPSGSCTVSTEYDCGGLWMGAGTDCDPNPCPTTGACCIDMACIITTQSGCTGEWMGAGSGCDPNPCCFSRDPADPTMTDRSSPANWTGPGQGTVLPTSDRDNPCPGSTLLDNTDGTYENGFAWQYAGQEPPYYGAFAEGYSGWGYVCGIRYMFTSAGGFSNSPMDVYVWHSDGFGPADVLSVTTGVHIAEPAYWPSISAHDVAVPSTGVHDEFFVGYWGNWPGALAEWYVAADLDGPGGHPRTNIVPGIGYPTGWQHVCVVWGDCHAIGICPYVMGGATRVETSTWGRIKSIYKDLEPTPAKDR